MHSMSGAEASVPLLLCFLLCASHCVHCATYAIILVNSCWAQEYFHVDHFNHRDWIIINHYRVHQQTWECRELKDGIQILGASLCFRLPDSGIEQFKKIMPSLLRKLILLESVLGDVNGGKSTSDNDFVKTMTKASDELNHIPICSANDLQNGVPTAARELGDNVKRLCVVRSLSNCFVLDSSRTPSTRETEALCTKTLLLRVALFATETRRLKIFQYCILYCSSLNSDWSNSW